MTKEQSIERSKASAATILNILGSATASLVPGGSLSYEAAKALFEHAMRFRNDTIENNISQFHKALLSSSLSTEEHDKFLNKPFEPEDYNNMISACVQDIESDKAELYGTLLRSLIDKNTDKETKINLVFTCKELRTSDIQLLRKISIFGKYDLIGFKGLPQHQVEHLVGSCQGNEKASLGRLASFGLFDREALAVTDFGHTFLEHVFDPIDLTPKSIGLTAYSGYRCNVFSYQLDADLGSINFISSELDGMGVKSRSFVVNKRNVLHSIQGDDAAIFTTSTGWIPEKELPYLVQYAEKRPLAWIATEAAAPIPDELKDLIKYVHIFNGDYSTLTKVIQDWFTAETETSNTG